MQTTLRTLPHLVFYEALAALEESAPAWNETVAGLLTLRLFDSWCDHERRGERVQAWQISGVAEAVDRLPEGHPARRTLQAVVESAGMLGGRTRAAIPHLSDYARALRFDARWLLAADVFSTILSNARGADPELVITAAIHRGYCLRMAGQLDAAAGSYDEARLLALSYGSEAGVLEAEVSHAILALHRGNLPAAESLLDAVIARANPATCSQVLARALHERAQVAARRGAPEDAVVYAYKALPLYERASDRDRVLGDIATALGEAGYHDAAWDGHQLVAMTAQEQEARWAATMNLVELAAIRGNEQLFHRYRQELTGVALPPWIAGYFHLYVGDGYRRFAQPALAQPALHAAVDVATRFELHEIRFRAEELLAQIDRAPVTVAPASVAPNREVAEVIAAVRSMREFAGVADG